jgi:hypothetical protein
MQEKAWLTIPQAANKSSGHPGPLHPGVQRTIVPGLLAGRQ